MRRQTDNKEGLQDRRTQSVCVGPEKGFVKLKNFKKNPNRFNRASKNNYLYILTPKGVTHKIKLTINFMKKKMQEYDELKKDLDKK